MLPYSLTLFPVVGYNSLMKRVNAEQPYSAGQFLGDLNREWGGNMYYGIIPPHEQGLLDIRPRLMRGLMALARQTNRSKPLEIVAITTNPARDFRKIAIAGMPHSKEAKDRLHMLADPYCRDFLHEQLEWMMQECITPKQPVSEEILIVEEQLPFTFDGVESEIFNTPFTLPSFDAHLARVKTRARMLGERLDLKPEELPRFVDQIHLGMDRASEYAKLCEGGREEDLHPMVKVSTQFMLAQYYLRPKGPSLFL